MSVNPINAAAALKAIAPPSSPVGSTLPVHSIRTCIVYDSANGSIRHQHHVLTLAGGTEPTDDQVAKDALLAAASTGKPSVSTLQVLHVAPDAVVAGSKYRIDLATKSLVLA
jgi:hypothetical protein